MKIGEKLKLHAETYRRVVLWVVSENGQSLSRHQNRTDAELECGRFRRNGHPEAVVERVEVLW